MLDNTPDCLENSRGRKLLADFILKSFGNCDKLEIFDKITSLYYQVNSVINISALKTLDDIYIKHYLDSIYPYSRFRGTCCDVGCGGGFPCIPLSVVTGLNFLGVDSVGKKLKLIGLCRTELDLTNIDSLHIRSENLAKSGKRFDTVCCRAVADTDKAISYCAPLTDVGGQIILYKTQNDTAAKNSTVLKYKVKLIDIEDYTLSDTDIHRRLFIYEKHN